MLLLALDWKFLWITQTEVSARRRLPSSSWLAKMPPSHLPALYSTPVKSQLYQLYNVDWTSFDWTDTPR